MADVTAGADGKASATGAAGAALSRNDFLVLRAIGASPERASQRGLAQATGLSLGSVNAAVRSCSEAGLVDDGLITEAGVAALEPYRVDNAVIMAAGLSSRFAPISYEKPKGILRVRGEVLIERQIRQLLEAGITDITVVLGYKKEYFFYLKGKYGVDLVVNPSYATRNNNGSLWLVRDRLANTYVCSSDNYFTENPFEPYVYEAYYAAEYADGTTDEWCMGEGPKGRINSVEIGGADAWYMLGHAYFDRAFSEGFVRILEEEYELPETSPKLWEAIFAEHLDELDMKIRKYPAGVINEFDSLDELEAFDSHFIGNVDSEIIDNIVSVLGCAKEDIHSFYPLKQGLTNLSCHFAVGDDEYVYRHPGAGTERMIDRRAEAAALELGCELGLDPTFLHMDGERGWKISRFVAGARTPDPHDADDLATMMGMCRKLHESGVVLERSFDFVDEGLRYEQLLEARGPIDVPGYHELREKVLRLRELAAGDGFAPCPSHNDFCSANVLMGEDGTRVLIDWEYAGMSDPASDFGIFCVCEELDDELMDRALEAYLGHEPSDVERRHHLAHVVFAGWCWYVWSLAKEAAGDNVDTWLYIYYRYAADYVDRVLSLYE